MRKFAILLLLAGSAAPALAADGPFDGLRERAQRSSQESSSDSNRSQRAQSSDSQRERSVATQGRRERAMSSSSGDGQGGAFRRQLRERSMSRQQPVAVPTQQQQPVVTTQDVRSGDRQRDRGLRTRMNDAFNGTYVPREREVNSVPGTVVTQHRDRDRASRHRGDYSRWTNHWRNDRRYDWRRHRDRNRSTFRLGFYYDPFGYSYRRYGIGSYLYPSYYQSNYWLNDPWQYRLPPAYGPYRWVRYYNDALLIDTWSGEVVDVIHGFFW